MIGTDKIQAHLARFPFGAAALYVFLVIGFLAATAFQVIDIGERHAAVAAASDILARLERQGTGARYALANGSEAALGSPFLEGTSVTVAGAVLLQRVAGAVTRVGGNVLSSQVDVQGPQSKQSFVVVTVSCEVDQPALQRMLYDLEAGMPFLFVDQLVVQAPAATASNANAQGGRLRVMIAVSGQWQGSK
jgi:general secretion pathway protein M